jgi:hypothetical protein
MRGISMRFVIVTTIGLLLGAAGAVQAQPCNTHLLNDDYGFIITGMRPSAPTPMAPLEQVVGVALTHFDGSGNLTQVDNVHGSLSGTVPDRPGTGSYTVNPDCTGTMTLQNAGAPNLQLRIVVVNHGTEVDAAVIAPAAVMVTSIGTQK